jgi:hypothetical protein
LAFSYWFDKPRFLTEGKLATVLIIPSSSGSQLGGYLPASDAAMETFSVNPLAFFPEGMIIDQGPTDHKVRTNMVVPQ